LWRRSTRARSRKAHQPVAPPKVDDIREILATIAFIDIVQSTVRVAEIGDRQWLQVLGEYHALVRSVLPEFGGREVKTLGDGSLVLFELPAQGIRCIAALRASITELQLEIRAGMHAGEVEANGVDVYGLAVHIAERISALAKPREILVSRTVKDLTTGAAVEFADRGVHSLKGVPGRWHLYAAEPRTL
jgi:class 3 adenylate cyclase